MLQRILPFYPAKTEFKLFILYTLLVIYGSLYPFNFQFQEIPLDTLLTPHITPGLIDLGDMGINLVLFMPFGFLGVRAMRSPFLPDFYSLVVTICCVPLAFGLQFLQIMIPSRVPSLLDTLLNVLGCGLAATLGAATRFRFFWGKRKLEHWKSIPLFLALSWLGYLLAPFVPSPDLGIIKDSLKPLLLHPELSVTPLLVHLAGWTLFAYALFEHRDQSLKTWQLALIMLGASCAQILIVKNAITLSQLMGAMGALMLWTRFRHRSDQTQTRLLFGLLLLTVSLRALSPFEFVHTARNDFQWLPFIGFLTGSRLINLHMLFQKIFFYGLTIFFLERSGTSTRMTVLLCFTWITLIEIAQLWYIQHTPETTDMIIVLATALMIKKYGQGSVRQKISYQGPERRYAPS